MFPDNFVSPSPKGFFFLKKVFTTIFLSFFFFIKKFLYFILPAGWLIFKMATIDLWQKP